MSFYYSLSWSLSCFLLFHMSSLNTTTFIFTFGVVGVRRHNMKSLRENRTSSMSNLSQGVKIWEVDMEDKTLLGWGPGGPQGNTRGLWVVFFLLSFFHFKNVAKQEKREGRRAQPMPTSVSWVLLGPTRLSLPRWWFISLLHLLLPRGWKTEVDERED